MLTLRTRGLKFLLSEVITHMPLTTFVVLHCVHVESLIFCAKLRLSLYPLIILSMLISVSNRWSLFPCCFHAEKDMCLATDACLTVDPGVTSSIPARSHTFTEIDHEIISPVFLRLPLIHSRRVVIRSFKRKYVHKLLVNRLFKLDHENVWLGELPSQHDHSCLRGREQTNQPC